MNNENTAEIPAGLPPISPLPPGRKSRKGLIIGLVLGGVLLTVGGFIGLVAYIYYTYIDSMVEDMQVAKSNMQQIGIAMQGFKEDFGSYPSDKTVERPRMLRVMEQHGALTGTSSNAYFRQLFYKQNGLTESSFYADVIGCYEADGCLGDGDTLRECECGFSYVVRQGEDGLHESVTTGPLLICSAMTNSSPTLLGDVSFDLISLYGAALILDTDGSMHIIREDEEISPLDEFEGKFIRGKEPYNAEATKYHLLLSPLDEG